MRRAAAAWVGAAAGMAMAVLACRQLVGIGDEPPAGSPTSPADAGAEAGFTYGQGTCATCVATSCAAQGTACAGSPSCSALEACMSDAGGDPTKRAQCGVDHGLGNDGVTPAFEACLASSCHDECGLTCGGLAAVFPPATAIPCQNCIVQGPCAAVTACAVEPACQTALRCQLSGDTLDVVEACPNLTQDAGPNVLGLTSTAPIAGSCSSSCSWGADWSCVGNVDWPPATLGPVMVTARVTDFSSLAPVDEVAVKICDSQDTSCGKPLGMGTTGPDGTAVMNRRAVSGSLLSYLDVSSSAIVPLISFSPFPVSEPRITGYVGTSTPEELALAEASIPGVTVNSDLGVVVVFAVDCRLGAAAGAQFSLDPKGTTAGPFYFANNGFSTTATATDTSGLAVFVNVPVLPAMFDVTVTPQALGHPSGKQTLFARTGTESVVYALPTP